jgi:hypothetical protein
MVLSAVSLGPVIEPPTILAEQELKPPEAAFAEAFNRIWRASFEPEPFQSIRGEFDSRFGGRYSTAVLPRAGECHVYETDDLSVAGTNIPLPVYDCWFSVTPADAEKSFNDLVRAIRQSPAILKVLPVKSIASARTQLRVYRKLAGQEINLISETDQKSRRRYRRDSCFQPRHLTIVDDLNGQLVGVRENARISSGGLPPAPTFPAVNDCA